MRSSQAPMFLCVPEMNIGAWLERIKALPGWKHPYDLMPGYPLQLA